LATASRRGLARAAPQRRRLPPPPRRGGQRRRSPQEHGLPPPGDRPDHGGPPRPRPLAGDLLRRVRRSPRQAARDQGDGRVSEPDAPAALEEAITRYNDAWNAHDLDAIMAMHAPDMVFENHTAGERAVGEEA